MDQNTNNIPQQGGSKALAIASMVTGICSIFPGWCIAWLPVILGLIAVVLGGIVLAKKMNGKGMAIAGLVTGILSLVIYIIVYIFVFSVATSAVNSLNSLL